MSDSVVASEQAGGRRKTAWMVHVKATMKTMSGEKSKLGKKWFSHVLKTAKKTYKKSHGGKKTRRSRK
jgi:hypothetical protein